jgi:hypothetical protein
MHFILDAVFILSSANLAMTELSYSLWKFYAITNSYYDGLYIIVNKNNLSFLFVLTSIVCIQNLTQFVYNTEQYKFSQVKLIMTNKCINEWWLTLSRNNI